MHFLLDVNQVGLEVENGQVLETFTHCAADCLAEREVLAVPMLTLPYQRIVAECLTRADALATLDEDAQAQQQSRCCLTGMLLKIALPKNCGFN